MLKIMARPRQAPCLLLGIGTYYVGAAHNTPIGAHHWQMLELKNPLILDGHNVRALYRRHGADARSRKAAAAGAWALRREVMEKGHDAIVAVEGVGQERHLTIAHFDSASAGRGNATVIKFPARDRDPATGERKQKSALAAAS